MIDWPQRAQQWHDACHVGAPNLGSCWCCCEECKPDWNPSSPNPYYTTAVNAIQTPVHE